MTQELYKKHRPKQFKEVFGQDDSTSTLLDAIRKRKLPHAIMFSGPSGVGKTTLARILVSKLQCSKSDFQEINAAMARGIDDIRNIERRMNSAPIGGPCRVWLLDEVHKLTNDAQNCVLKMLEDTPKHVYFFLCTTMPGKVISTVRNRCTEVKLRSLTAKEISELVLSIVEKEGVEVDEEVIDRIAEIAEGSARKALVTLDQIISLDSTEKQLNAIISSDTKREAIEICRLLFNPHTKWPQVAAVLKAIDEPEEGIRHLILGYADKVLLGSGKSSERAYTIISAMRDPFYDCGKSGLHAACYEIVLGK